jgi:hypothetical protein
LAVDSAFPGAEYILGVKIKESLKKIQSTQLRSITKTNTKLVKVPPLPFAEYIVT